MQDKAEITIAAQDHSLVSVYYIRVALNITDVNLDEQLEMFARWSSDEIATMCNRVFARETLVETFSDFDDQWSRLWLSHYPVVEITSVTEDGVVLDPSEYEVNKKTGRLFRLNDEFWTGPVVVSYTGGYNLPYEAPEALQQAATLLIREAYNASTRGDTSIRMVAHKESRVIYFDPNAKAGAAAGASSSPARRATEQLLKKYTRFYI